MENTNPEVSDAPQETEQTNPDFEAFQKIEDALGYKDPEPMDPFGNLLQEEDEAAEESEEAPGRSESHEAALQDIRRVKGFYPESALERLTEEEALDLAQQAREEKSARDREHQARQAAEPSHSEADEAEGSGKAPSQPESYPSVEWEEISQPVIDELGEENGAKFLEGFKKVFDLVQSFAPVASEWEAMQRRQDNVQNAVFNRFERDARDRLSSTLPELSDESTYQDRIVPRMRSLFKTGEYNALDGIGQLMEDAYRWEFGAPSNGSSAKARKQEIANAKRNGVPGSAPSKPSAAPPMSRMDRERAAFLALDGGKSVAEARQMGGFGRF